MICDHCHTNEAVIRFAEIRNGTMRVRNICDECAKATGIADQLERTIASLGEAVGGAMASLLRTGAGAAECPGCGMTIDEFRRHGRLGCERCIEAFAAVLAPLLERTGDAGRHGADNRRQALEQRLREAVADEEYELAARLRDELKELTTAVGQQAGPGPQTTSSVHD
jgi:protein arginine kinase activator